MSITAVLTTHKICPRCKTEVTVETEGILGTLGTASCLEYDLKRLDREGGYITPSCCRQPFYVEPKPKPLTFIQRLRGRRLQKRKA